MTQKLKRLPLLKQLGDTLRSLPKLGNKLLATLPRLPDPLTMVAWICGFLLLLALLFGCSPRTVKPSLPPQADARPVPEFQGKTYRDVLLYVIELRESAYASESDKAAIRDVFQ